MQATPRLLRAGNGEIVMSKYSLLSIFQTNARRMSSASGVKLSLAQEKLAKSCGFNNLHELQAVAKKGNSDPRLIKCAFGDDDLKELIYETPFYEELGTSLEDQLSGEIASTNASEFTPEDIEPESATYDEKSGKLTISGSLSYSGEQDEDRAYSGHSFFVDFEFYLLYRSGRWQVDATGKSLSLTDIKSGDYWD